LDKAEILGAQVANGARVTAGISFLVDKNEVRGRCEHLKRIGQG
jgi:hypothetical protein